MFLFRRFPVDARSLVRALRGLSKIFSREARGLLFLRNWLSSEQRAQFDANRYFNVIGCDSGRRYRIYYVMSNVYEIDAAGCPECFLPDGRLVVGYIMLAQKILWKRMNLACWRWRIRWPPNALPHYAGGV
jgi:hypothetical protein